MNFLWNLFSNLTTSIGSGASTMCAIVFYEPEMPESLREE